MHLNSDFDAIQYNSLCSSVGSLTNASKIARKGAEKYYIQSALSMDDPQKQDAELKSLRAVKGSFKKIVVSKSYGKSWIDEEGILRINIIDFLLDAESLKR